jgi:hypothetical protein
MTVKSVTGDFCKKGLLRLRSPFFLCEKLPVHKKQQVKSYYLMLKYYRCTEFFQSIFDFENREARLVLESKVEVIHHHNRLVISILWTLFLIYLVVQVVTGKDTNFILLFFVSGFFVCGFITFLTWKKIFITQTMYVCVIGMSAVSFVILWNEPVVANFYLLFLAIFMMGLYQDYRPVLLMGGIGLLIGGYFYSHFGTRMNYVYREGDFIFFVFTMVVTLVG